MKFKPYNHSEAALNERIALIVNAEKKRGGEKEALRTVFQSIDFTTLEAFDNEAKMHWLSQSKSHTSAFLLSASTVPLSVRPSNCWLAATSRWLQWPAPSPRA